MTDTPLLEIKNLEKHFEMEKGLLETIKLRRGKIVKEKRKVHAVNNVSLTVKRGETLCLVGESGCGKSTIARLVAGLIAPSAGEVYYDGKRIDGLTRKELKPIRGKLQMVFQNPYASLNPRMSIQQTLEEPIRQHKPYISRAQVRDKVSEIMDSVGIDASWASHYPHEFSGGQRQRIAIARALTVDPEFIIADEPISALDVSIQAQVLNLLQQAMEERNLTYLFITHDLAVVRHFATRVAVLYLGSICELATTDSLFANPQHPYTQALLSAAPDMHSEKSNHIHLNGEIPTPVKLPTGCYFHSRCPYTFERCKVEKPAIRQQPDGRLIACHKVAEGG